MATRRLRPCLRAARPLKEEKRAGAPGAELEAFLASLLAGFEPADLGLTPAPQSAAAAPAAVPLAIGLLAALPLAAAEPAADPDLAGLRAWLDALPAPMQKYLIRCASRLYQLSLEAAQHPLAQSGTP